METRKDVTAYTAAVLQSQNRDSSIMHNKLNDINASVLQSHYETQTSSAVLQQKLNEVLFLLGTSSSAAENQLKVAQARIELMEKLLIESLVAPSIPPSKSTSRTSNPRIPRRLRFRVSTTTHRSGARVGQGLSSKSRPTSIEATVKIIKPSLLTFEEGRVCFKLHPLQDTSLEHIDIEKRKSLIRYLQSLRLLIWLFREDNYVSGRTQILSIISQSQLAAQARITSLWEFYYSFTELKSVLCIQSPALLPWVRCKHWLQYMFDRVEDREEDGEEIMNMIVNQWSLFPPPDCAIGYYNVPVPQYSADFQVQTLRLKSRVRDASEKLQVHSSGNDLCVTDLPDVGYHEPELGKAGSVTLSDQDDWSGKDLWSTGFGGVSYREWELRRDGYKTLPDQDEGEIDPNYVKDTGSDLDGLFADVYSAYSQNSKTAHEDYEAPKMKCCPRDRAQIEEAFARYDRWVLACSFAKISPSSLATSPVKLCNLKTNLKTYRNVTRPPEPNLGCRVCGANGSKRAARSLQTYICAACFDQGWKPTHLALPPRRRLSSRASPEGG
jgi:hypothetical protein